MKAGLPPLPEPVIDYLAKDYGSFRQTMIAAMMQRVPEWEPTSEADLDMVLADLFSVAADELSDYQDRVMNEAFISSARKRVSLARHSRLMDYHIHQGHQAATWLAIEIGHEIGQKSFQLKEGLKAWAGVSTADAPKKETDLSVVFMSRHQTQTVHQYLNNVENLVISIVDNGIGIKENNKKIGNGLTNLKNRMNALNGTLIIESENGASITFSIPLIVSNKNNS